MSRAQRAVGVAIAVALLVVLTALSRVTYATHDAERALLRLSWRARGERIERCRRATAAELANVPAHMRREVICEGVHVAPYRLRVAVDEHTLADGIVAGTGVAGDRPIYLLREFAIHPGERRVQVTFDRQAPAGDAGETGEGSGAANPGRDQPRPGRESTQRDHEREARRGTVPPHLTIDTTLVVRAGSVILVTYDSELRRLQLVTPR